MHVVVMWALPKPLPQDLGALPENEGLKLVLLDSWKLW